MYDPTKYRIHAGFSTRVWGKIQGEVVKNKEKWPKVKQEIPTDSKASSQINLIDYKVNLVSK